MELFAPASRDAAHLSRGNAEKLHQLMRAHVAGFFEVLGPSGWAALAEVIAAVPDGIPVILVTGDQSVAAEAHALLGAVETVEAKHATSRVSADCLPPALAQAQIQEGARRAVSGLLAGTAPAPFQVSTPVTAGIEFHFTEMADVAGRMPRMRRIDGRTLEFTAVDMIEAYRTFRSAVVLGRAA